MSNRDLLSDPDILRELIMDHYKYPHHHSLVEGNEYLSHHMASESCIDDITVQAKMNQDVIEDIRFDGVACTISTASTSMMTDLLIGKTKEEAKAIIDEYFKMIDGKEYDEEMLQEAVAMKNVYKQANLIKCATIGWKAIQSILESEPSNE